jgi:hypothetical protein
LFTAEAQGSFDPIRAPIAGSKLARRFEGKDVTQRSAFRIEEVNTVKGGDPETLQKDDRDHRHGRHSSHPPLAPLPHKRQREAIEYACKAASMVGAVITSMLRRRRWPTAEKNRLV